MRRSLRYTIILLLLFVSVTGQSQDSIKSKDISVIKVSEIGKKHLGMTIEEAIKRFKLDTGKAYLQQEPPMVIRGIKAELNDSTILYLQIKRTYFEAWDIPFNMILQEKITGIALAFSNCREKHWGTGFVWWGIQNPFCKNPPLHKNGIGNRKVCNRPD